MLGLAEYFAKIPKEQRRRTIYFLGTSGHHDNSGMTGHWLADHKELFAKTALIINCEHTSAEQACLSGDNDPQDQHDRPAALVCGRQRAAGADRRQSLRHVRRADLCRRGACGRRRDGPLLSACSVAAADRGQSLTGIPTARAPTSFRRPGLAASTRAYAKIITDVNQLSLKELQRPAATEARR
jgi:hypothetical protein